MDRLRDELTVANIEAIVEPDGVGTDFGWKSVSFVCVHPPILAIVASYGGDTINWGQSKKSRAEAPLFSPMFRACTLTPNVLNKGSGSTKMSRAQQR